MSRAVSHARRLYFTCVVLLLSLFAGGAQALEPFVAQYAVYRGGDALGEATMRLTPGERGRWRVDLVMRGTGLLRIAGLNAEQSTVFDTEGGVYRPLSQATVRRTVFTRRQTTGVYDWATRQARWQGDVKKTRRAPVPLQPGDMSGLLINLAAVRDARPGATLEYRFVDDGRTRLHRYAVADALEPVSVGDLRYDAMRVARVQHGGDETVLWIVDGVPTPVRLLQREDGRDTFDLRLIEYTGTQ
ncbi:DUF3108 domain-containing protein [Cognatilysobacter bugurensis]|uniref:DUF3108 domain-containing protein n=1 Tax=Cognatilysobacter bugurensis TaxID=543356 RepID=A0A918SZT8_9GAMM|nr:DUF3108 domain-containing protein [Lysobacter bugurensis]GHA77377.1 hypothetical protein GCM10007067_13450 [Lysobacter bugurensis]